MSENIKKAIYVGLCLAQAFGATTGIAGGVLASAKQSKLKDEVFASLRADETSRLTTEYNVAKSDFEIKTEKFLAGEISESEYFYENVDFKEVEENFKKDLEKLESNKYLEELMEEKAFQDAGLLKKRDEIATLGKVRAVCIALGCVGAFTLACTTILGASI